MPASSSSRAAVALTGIGLVCPQGSSPRALLAASAGAMAPAGGDGDWFDPTRHLGKRGFKYLTPATRYALAAARLALGDAGLDDSDPYQSADKAAVVGTNFAAAPVLERMDRVVVAEGADALSPVEAPSFSVNIPSSHLSMRHGLRAFNISLTNPVVAGVEAVLLLGEGIAAGRARMGLAGATEERPGPAAAAVGVTATGDGACTFVLERLDDAAERGAPVRALLAGGFSRFLPPRWTASGDGRRTLAAMVDDAVAALLDAAPDGTRVIPYAPLAGRFEASRLADELVAGSLERLGVEVRRLRYHGADGEYLSVSPLLQAAAAIAEHGAVLVVAASPHGHVAALSLRPPPARPGASVEGA